MSVPESFNVGDVVRLNAGGPELLVQNTKVGYNSDITVVWIQRDGYGQLTANPACFQLIRRAHDKHDIEKDCTDSACSLLSFNAHRFGPGCRLYRQN